MIQESRPFNNCGLFSNHYLENLIQSNPEWNQDSQLEGIFTKVKDLFHRRERQLESYIESDLEHNFIRPVFDILGHYYGIQETVYGTALKPDYAFFPNRETYEEAYAKKDDKEFYSRAVAVGDAKAWKVRLDKSQQGRASYEMGNPSYQIDVYLRATPPKWAILTNGRYWRLYHEDTSSKLDCYYEVDLPQLIKSVEASGDLQPFKYFYHFFRREAFPQLPLGESFLDRVREGSVAYAKKIGDDLRDNVYSAMKALAEGFLKDPGNELSPTEADIREIQENSMRLLYRLLFIFYAEGRGLLDAGNRHYQQLSLQRMKSEIAQRLDSQEDFLKVKFGLWTNLEDLFSLINEGSEKRGIERQEFYIPPYNGGLFDPEKNRFLAEKRVGDYHLSRAIDLLARSSSGGEGGQDKSRGFVDYSSLEIRHLGSIYEGILEYRLKVADQELVAIKEKGREVWLPKEQAGVKKAVDRADAGSVYLVTDKGERKATGSYYTPDYIVKYIVENTLRPIIDPLVDKAVNQEDGLTKELLPKRLLSLKVLDPAMGSGHFLVEATDYIAREVIHAREMARPEELESEDVAEHDIHWARREVVRNCIYGVDLNPMAVELAKLSLWLTTVASNKPLSFLDHHLRCGNSLIGAKLDGLMALPNSKRDPEQLPMWQFVIKQQKEHTEELLRQYADMAGRADDDLQTVKWKEEKYKALRESELSRRLCELANVWLSTYFGYQVEEIDYEELQNHLSPNRFPDWSAFRGQEWFRRAQALASEKRFFHWELEFPEAFSGKENPGFDVVIGNPPYVRQELIVDDKPYLEQIYEVYSGRADIYEFFIEKGIRLLNSKGYISFITSRKFMNVYYGKSLRNLIIRNTTICGIVDFGDLPVFGEVIAYPSILILRKIQDAEERKFIYTKIRSIDSKSIESEIKDAGMKVDQENLAKIDEWIFQESDLFEIKRKVELISKSLSKICGDPLVGIKTGLNSIFITDWEGVKKITNGSQAEERLFKRFLFGKLIKRFEIILSDSYLLFPYEIDVNGNLVTVPLDDYPNIRDYLESQKNQIVSRAIIKDKAPKGELEWYELQQINKNISFEKPKIIYPDISDTSNFTLDTSGYLIDMTAFVLESDDPYILSLLNSKLLTWYLGLLCARARGDYLRFKSQYVSRLPIRRISFSTPDPERARLVSELKALYQAGKFDEILSSVEACLPKDAQGNFTTAQEKSDVVHDLLAFLAEQMLEMNKQKQQEIKDFLIWLEESELGAKVDDLSPKTKIQAYYNLEFPEFLEILKKNKKRLKEGYDPSKPATFKRLREAFDDSVSNLLPIFERIEKTDRLIDQIVYKLYGLTEEEIGIVEGKNPK